MKRWIVAVGVAVGIVALTRSAHASVVGMMPAHLSNSQRAAAEAIERTVADVAPDLSTNAVMAMIANAWRESKLNPMAQGDCSSGTCHSFGLFQLNTAGAGHDLDVANMLDPAFNTRVILEREVLAGRGKGFRAADANGASAQELAAIFCVDIERPANKVAGADASRAAVRTLFGDV